jgi:hypothetical protein
VTPRVRLFSTMFAMQLVAYSLMCLNFRAVAQAHYLWSALTDFALATLSYFVIRKIAASNETFAGWAGYSLGGVAGSFAGIWLSVEVLGK